MRLRSHNHRGAWVGWAILGVYPLLWMLSVPLLFLWKSLPIWRARGLEPLTGSSWFFRAEHFGGAPMLFGTAVVSGIALLLAAPMGIGTAACVQVFVRGKAGLAVKAMLELLAAVPSVVYGLLGIMFLRPWMAEFLRTLNVRSGDSLLAAGVVLAVMILPTLASLADDAFRGTSDAEALAARGLGLDRMEVFCAVRLPAAAPALFGAIWVALGRGIGETIAVFMVVGRQDNQPLSLRSLVEAGQTLTSKLGGPELHVAEAGSLHASALMALAVLLLLFSGLTTGAGLRLRRRRPA